MQEIYETDEKLYERYLAKRDEEAFRVLFLRHKEPLILFLIGFVHSPEDAEELMIDAFAETAAGRTLFSGRSSFKTWLYSIGKKKAISFIRRARPAAGEDELPGESRYTPEMEILKDERKELLYRALDTLHPEYRQVLTLLYFEEMSVEDAARVMGKSKKQVYHLTERGKSALREELERRGYADAY